MQGHKRFEDLIESAMAEAHTAPTVRDDIAFWLYTSGSTGKPKGAVHVHADLKLTDDLYGGPYPRTSPRTTSAIRWRSCSSPTASAMR